MPITLRELKPAEIPSIYPLIRQLNLWMSEEKFAAMLAEMMPGGYRVVAAYDGDALVGLSGFWMRTRFWSGKQMDIDNFVVSEAVRGKGVGTLLAEWLEATAAREHCELIVLDTYVERVGAQEFYTKQGFYKTGYHMTKMPGSREPGALPYSVNKALA